MTISLRPFAISYLHRPSLAGIAFSMAMVGVATIVLAGVIAVTDIRHISIGYVIPVVISAVRWGIIESVIAALTAIAASAFFFYPPIFSFEVHDPQQITDLVLFIFVAMVIGHLASRLREEATRANRRETAISDLYSFSRRLAVAQNAADIVDAIRQHVSSLVGPKVLLFSPTQTHAAPELSADTDLPAAIRNAVRDALDEKNVQGDRTLADERSGNLWLVRPLSHDIPDYGVIAIDLGPRTDESEEDIRARIGAILADATSTLQQVGISAAINEASIRAQADRFRDALIGSVSHELRTPLSSILGAATVLASAPAVQREPQLAALANVAREEAVRLNNDIQNLLDATRISSQGVEPKFGWTEPIDIVNSALERRRAMLADHQVEVRLQNNLPLIYVDSVLVEQALGQIIDNAGKYSAAGSRIQIEGRQQGDQVMLSVTDQGAGIAPEDKAKLGERFFRGSRHAATTTGSGLGLWIAKAFLSAHGGTLTMDSVDEGGGTTVSLRLPIPLMTDDQMSPSHE